MIKTFFEQNFFDQNVFDQKNLLNSDSIGPSIDAHAAAGIASLFNDSPKQVQDPLPIMDDPCSPTSAVDSDLMAALAASQEQSDRTEAHRRATMEDEALQLALQDRS